MNQPTAYPTGINLSDDKRLVIHWSDDAISQIPFKVLRDNCPCAHCRVAALDPQPVDLLPVISAAEARPLIVENMMPASINSNYFDNWEMPSQKPNPKCE